VTPSAAAYPPNYRFRAKTTVDSSGFGLVTSNLPSWSATTPLAEVARAWGKPASRLLARLDQQLSQPQQSDRITLLLNKASLLLYDGEAESAYAVLGESRVFLEQDRRRAEAQLYTVIYFQGLAALRRGENDNCIRCRGESSCIFPIAAAAVHTNPTGSRLAVRHFTEYLHEFPDDLEVKWLLNLAHMTLGEHPQAVDPRFLLTFDRFTHPEASLGKFRDIGHLAGVNRFGQAGGVVMDDFDGDGLLDLVLTEWDATRPMTFYRNQGDGTFEDRTRQAGLLGQLGGLNLAQADFNNDGYLDLLVVRGAWLDRPIRPSLLRNRGDGTFEDVTAEAGLAGAAVNSNCAAWADYDNDGFVDVFLCNETGYNRLYRNQGDGTFEDVTAKAGVQGENQFCKGAAWIDYDNDGYPDLFINNLNGSGQLYHNNRDGTFREVTWQMGITGPKAGFACWAWDYDNDGWLDILALSRDHSVQDVVRGMLGQPHGRYSCKLFRNLQGKGFQDVTRAVGLDMVFAPMGCNFGDLDNDGYLDFYLGTGDPNLAALVPNRLFKNVAGRRFAEVTGTSGTGHLQKGHGVAIGDWRRSGNCDIVIEMGGAVPGDQYHTVLFRNPGQGNHWLTVKLVGVRTNRAALGARIKVVTAGPEPLTVHRHVSSGSSFGGNPLQQTLGLGKAERVAVLEVHWPTSGTTQVFRDVAVDQAIEVTEFAPEYRPLHWTPVPDPK
jgi:hypothetical protein